MYSIKRSPPILAFIRIVRTRTYTCVCVMSRQRRSYLSWRLWRNEISRLSYYRPPNTRSQLRATNNARTEYPTVIFPNRSPRIIYYPSPSYSRVRVTKTERSDFVFIPEANYIYVFADRFRVLNKTRPTVTAPSPEYRPSWGCLDGAGPY